jgi:hypothetical protein
MAKYDLTKHDALPPCDGPKLGPFSEKYSSIEFLEILSKTSIAKTTTNGSKAESDQPSGGHGGHVFKVRINDQQFALKMVRILLS